MGRRGYPPEFRRKVLDLVDAGRPIAEVAQALGSSGQSSYSWRRQDRIDRGLEPGLTSAEQAELAVAKRRIAELETELHAMRRAMELVRAVVPPKAVPGGRGDGCRAHPGRGGLPGPGRVDLGLLRLQVPPAVPAIGSPRLADRPDRRGPPALPWHLRRPAGACRAAPWPRDPGRPQRRCPAAAPRRPGRRHRPAQVAPRQARPGRHRPGRPPVLPHRAQPAVGDRQHRAPHQRGQALLRGGPGHRLAAGGRLVDRCRAHSGARDHRIGHGHRPAHPPTGVVVHSDQGVQFASWAFTQRAKDSGLVPSMAASATATTTR
jgi:transposase